MKAVLFNLRRSVFHNEGNPDIGRILPSVISSAGLEILSVSASYSCASTPRAKQGMYRAMAGLWTQAEFPAQAEALGWISTTEREGLVQKLEEEALDPASFSGTTYVEVVAKKC